VQCLQQRCLNVRLFAASLRYLAEAAADVVVLARQFRFVLDVRPVGLVPQILHGAHDELVEIYHAVPVLHDDAIKTVIMRVVLKKIEKGVFWRKLNRSSSSRSYFGYLSPIKNQTTMSIH